MERPPGAVLAIAATALALLPSAGPASAAHQPTAVHTDEVCLPAHNPDDPNPQSLYGVRFWSRPVTSATRTIVLVHGAHMPGTRYWDWSPDFSFARTLARAGYLVLAYDRLGYGNSPYKTGDGSQLTAVGAQKMLHNVVDDVHQGGWTTARGHACAATAPGPVAGPGTRSVSLIGNSLGAWAVAGYPGHYHDVDAIVPIGATHTGVTPDALTIIYPPTVAAYAAEKDRVDAEPDEATCTKVFLYPPGVAPAAQNFCRLTQPTVPIGEFARFPEIFPNNLPAIAQTDGTPVLLVYGDHDVLFATENEQAEYDYWQGVCNCPVQLWIQPDAGHGTVLHRSMPQLAERVLAFLADHHLSA